MTMASLGFIGHHPQKFQVPLKFSSSPNLIICSGPPNYFGLKFLGPPLKLGGCYDVTLLRWLTFLLGPQTVILIVLLFLISFFLLMLVFVLQSLSLHWEILIMLLSQFPLAFLKIHNGMPRFMA